MSKNKKLLTDRYVDDWLNCEFAPDCGKEGWPDASVPCQCFCLQFQSIFSQDLEIHSFRVACLSLSLSLSLYLVDGLYLKVAYGCNSAIFIQFFLSRGPIDYFGVLQGCRNRLKEYGLSLLEAKASLLLFVFLSMKSNMNSSCNSKS